MNLFNCAICNKTFNSNQHLTQHKNKKNPCKQKDPSTDGLHFPKLEDIMNTPFNNFMLKYQQLLEDNHSKERMILGYHSHQKELFEENRQLKQKLKQINQIIKSSGLESDDSDMVSSGEQQNVTTTSTSATPSSDGEEEFNKITTFVEAI